MSLVTLSPGGRVYYYPSFPVEKCVGEYKGEKGDVYQRLLIDIRDHGVHTPLWGMTVDREVRIRMGKQRLTIARELGMWTLPVVVWDAAGILSGDPMSDEEVRRIFPENFTFTRNPHPSLVKELEEEWTS